MLQTMDCSELLWSCMEWVRFLVYLAPARLQFDTDYRFPETIVTTSIYFTNYKPTTHTPMPMTRTQQSIELDLVSGSMLNASCKIPEWWSKRWSVRRWNGWSIVCVYDSLFCSLVVANVACCVVVHVRPPHPHVPTIRTAHLHHKRGRI